MKFGVMFANAGPATAPDQALAVARAAEDHGFESLWTVEHVVVPAGFQTQYPYSKDGKLPGGEDVPIADPLIWLAFVAAHTERIKLGTGILILPQRNPLVLAKEVATLDVLSRGRVLLGVGVGWLKEEFEALGIPFEARGKRTDEHIGALRAAWTQDEPTFDGEMVSFKGAKSWPKPAQPGGVPIVVGGHSPAAARRAGRLGDGFFPVGAKPDDLGPLITEMRKAAADASRHADGIEITTTGGGSLDADKVKRFAELGVSRLVIGPGGFDEESVKRSLGGFAETVMAKL